MTIEIIRYQRNPDFIFRKVIEEMILMPIHQNVADMAGFYTLDEVGAYVWEKLSTPTTINELVEAVYEEFDVSMDIARKDLSEFVAELHSIGAITGVD